MTLTLEQPVTASAGGTAAAVVARCECCGGEHDRVARKRGYKLHRCRGCGVVFVAPQPTPAALEKLYRKDAGYFATARTDLSQVPPSSAAWLHDALIQAGGTTGKFLDVGCATGSLMWAMRGLGWSVSGVDVNRDATDIAKRNGLDATAATLHDAGFADEAFDVANMGDVIEHVPSPREMCAEIHRILRPRGLLAVRTPNAAGGFAAITLLAARFGARTWAHSEAPYHLHEFTPRGLRALLDSVGFDIVTIRCEGRGRLLYKLGATGSFDDLKRRIKGARGFSRVGQVLLNLPKLLVIGAAIAPAYAMGTLLDRVRGSGASIFLIARKKAA
jgi:SAM-dependent methyltransferase